MKWCTLYELMPPINCRILAEIDDIRKPFRFIASGKIMTIGGTAFVPDINGTNRTIDSIVDLDHIIRWCKYPEDTENDD